MRKNFLYSNECNRQRFRCIFFYRVTDFYNLMSLVRDFHNHNPYSSPPKFKREVKEYLFDLAKHNFKLKSHPYGWTVFEGNEIKEMKKNPVKNLISLVKPSFMKFIINIILIIIIKFIIIIIIFFYNYFLEPEENFKLVVLRRIDSFFSIFMD